jgi:hypothetical protein
VVGVLLVVASVLAGATLFSRADDTVAVWAARSDLAAGSSVGPEDLVRRQVRFTDAGAADRYLAAGASLPTGATLVRDVGAGELLPRAALGRGPSRPLVQVPLSTASELVPATVRPGSVVDVWVAPGDQADPGEDRAVRVLDDVVVVDVPSSDSSLAPSSTRQVIVGVDERAADRLDRTLALTTTGTVVLTTQGGE